LAGWPDVLGDASGGDKRSSASEVHQHVILTEEDDKKLMEAERERRTPTERLLKMAAAPTK
jgi:hypothetical protein